MELEHGVVPGVFTITLGGSGPAPAVAPTQLQLRDTRGRRAHSLLSPRAGHLLELGASWRVGTEASLN